jgi:hypothetical protein
VGNETFSSVLNTFKNDPEKLGKELAQNFNMPSYVAFRVMYILNRFYVTIVSDFSKSHTEILGFKYTDSIDRYIKNLKGNGYIIPFAENILPVFYNS